MQTAVGKAEELASSPTFSRLETRATRADVMALNRVLIEQFIAAQGKAPDELILDVDASDVPLHGDQELSQFHGYYDHYCYLPLYVFCGQAMLACVLRPSRIDGAKHAAVVIRLIVTRLRQAWPRVRLVVRGDSGFCRQRLIRWCERYGVGYVIGVARNARLHARVAAWEQELEAAFVRDGTKQRAIHAFRYAADSWNIERRVVTRLEYGSQGSPYRVLPRHDDKHRGGRGQYVHKPLNYLFVRQRSSSGSHITQSASIGIRQRMDDEISGLARPSLPETPSPDPTPNGLFHFGTCWMF